METVEFKKYIEILPELLQSDNRTVLVTSDKIYVLNGVENSLNFDYCGQNNIEILQTRHFGGTIVNFKDDLCVGNYQKRFNDFGEKFTDTLNNFFISNGLNSCIEGNDILVDGYKVASSMSTNVNGTLYTAFHITVNCDLELIKKVCTKPMVKVPKALTDFGITKQEIIDFIQKEI